MRIAHIYCKSQDPSKFRSLLDTSVEDFSETMRVEEYLKDIRSWDDFEKFFGNNCFVKEFIVALSQVLIKERRTLSIGSCLGENEAPFVRDGFDLVCSDINPAIVSHMQKNFGPGNFILFNIFSSQLSKNDFQDLLVTGLDYAFDDFKTREIFQKCREILKGSSAPGEKRLLFTLRYKDNWATKFIDRLVLPAEKSVKNTIMKIRKSPTRYFKKVHGFRRSKKEIISFALQEGFQLRRTVYGGYGIEFTRSFLGRFGILRNILIKLDHSLKLLNCITVFEFVLQ